MPVETNDGMGRHTSVTPEAPSAGAVGSRHDLVDSRHEPKNLPEPSRPRAEPDGFSWMSFKTIAGYQWKTLVQIEALTAYALFQHAFHPLRPGNLDFEFGQFLLSQ